MTLLELGTAADIRRRRERLLAEAEGRLEDAADAAMRRFLRQLTRAITTDALTAAAGLWRFAPGWFDPRLRPVSLTAAADFPRSLRLFEVGEAAGWWEDAVRAEVVDAVRSVWRTGYHDTRDGEIVTSSLQAAEDHIASVVDRLSRTATPTIPDQAFDVARVAVSDEMARGSSIDTISRRLAAEFSWDEDATFWRGRLSDLDGQVDRILDPIGPPGDAQREWMRLNDPQVADLQAQRAEAVKHIDRVESTWQTRAERIARTETTGAYNAGALDAGAVEGAGAKVWMATGDDRTRDTHLDAHGQCVGMGDRFEVGGDLLEMPGDPAGAPEETINCRCTVVFADDCGDAERRFGFADELIDEERDRRDPDSDTVEG